MDALTVVLTMVGVAALLFVGAVLADRLLERRAQRRRSAETGGAAAPARGDAADAVIDLLDRAREIARSWETADEEKQDTSASSQAGAVGNT